MAASEVFPFSRAGILGEVIYALSSEASIVAAKMKAGPPVWCIKPELRNIRTLDFPVRGWKGGGPVQRTAEKVSHVSLTSPEKDAIEMIVQGKIAGIEF